MPQMNNSLGVKIESVENLSIAWELSLHAGDVILEINGYPVTDQLDILFYENDWEIELTVLKRNGEIEKIHIEKEPEEPLGITCTAIPMRKCKNKCIFCFVHQLPKGMRKSLYVKDEDYRYSFLHGQYVTLSHCHKEDEERIIRLHLSPLYISVHCTDDEVRNKMLGVDSPISILPLMKRLAGGGIRMHTQIVLCPGINDGRTLDNTISDLGKLYPSVQSIAIVPVGLTKHRRGLPQLQAVTKEYSHEIIRHIESLQKQCQHRFNTPLVYLADEFYLISNNPFPPKKHYGDFPQIENGVGLCRTFIDEWRACLDMLMVPPQGNLSLATGRQFAPVLSSLLREKGELLSQVTIVPIENRAFGPSITVSGLLTGCDIIEQMPQLPADAIIMIPSSCINSEGVTLDDLTPEKISERLGKRVLVPGNSAFELIKAINTCNQFE